MKKERQRATMNGGKKKTIRKVVDIEMIVKDKRKREKK